MISYILQVILFQVLFLVAYDFFLSKETFFTKNRWYLLSTPILSFFIPLIKIPTFQKTVPQEFMVYLPEIVLSPDKVIQNAFQDTTFDQSINYVTVLFWVGVSVFSILFLIKLVKIISLIRKHEAIQKTDFTLVFIPNKTNAFSFFNYVFLGKEIPASQQSKILEHELVHSKQKHSLDLLFFEFLKIVMWFNPMIYFYQKRITLVHEYISDAVVAKSETKEAYINNLLSNFFQVENISFINQFYKQTFIKKRIIMMKKTQSKRMNQLKYLVLIPVLASMLFYTSCSETLSNDVNSSKLQLETRYRLKEGKLVGKEGGRETYLDSYFGIKAPVGVTEISFDKLSTEEKEEYILINEQFAEGVKAKPEIEQTISFKIYQGKNNRRILATILDFSKMKRDNTAKNNAKTDEVSFMTIDKAPTFPGCEEGDKKCFSSMIQKHFTENFDAEIVNNLGLSSGKKRIFIGFKIDKEGNVIDVKARAPHEDIKEEVLSVMTSLPKMIAGENKGEKVNVMYSIPFTIVVD